MLTGRSKTQPGERKELFIKVSYNLSLCCYKTLLCMFCEIISSRNFSAIYQHALRRKDVYFSTQLNFILQFVAFVFKETGNQGHLLNGPSVRLWIAQNIPRKYTRTFPEPWQVDNKTSRCMAPMSVEPFSPLFQKIILLTTNEVIEWLPMMQ